MSEKRRSVMKCLNCLCILSILSIGLLSCGEDSGYSDPFSQGDIFVDSVAKSITLKATYNANPAEAGTWHLLVHKDGTNGSPDKAIFSTDVSPYQYYQALKQLGADDLNTVNFDNLAEENVFTQGSKLAFSITWDGAGKSYLVEEFLEEIVPQDAEIQSKLGLEIRFGGNRTKEDVQDPKSDTTGCLACLYSCAAGISSNAKANLHIKNTDSTDGNIFRYTIAEEIDCPDKTIVTITITVTGGWSNR